jgi:S1-C subfamily serine protease/pSer/pThr/pTyr-binding forkhead associated (FHA) protein
MQLTIKSGPDAGKTVEVDGEEFTIGADPGADLRLIDAGVSPRHAALRPLADGRATLIDLGSGGGTFVDGERVQSKVLSGGEEVRVGDTVLAAVARESTPSSDSTARRAIPAGMDRRHTPPATPVPAPPAPPAPTRESFGATPSPPPPAPTRRPSRTQSAIQRIMLQRAVNRATFIGVVAIVLVVVLGVLLAAGVFDKGKSSPAALTNAQIVERVKPSTYMVVTNLGTTASRGTGWVWDAAHGIIVTNAHVVQGGSEWNVATGDHLTIQVQGSSVVLTPGGQDARLVGEADCEDIGVLQVKDASRLVTMPRGSQRDLHIGDHVVAVGYPGTLTTMTSQNFSTPGFTSGDLSATSGDVSQVQTTFGAIPPEAAGQSQIGPYKNVILTDTVINKGNSGGPLLDDRGRLVGMNSAGRGDVQGQNYAVGVDRINQIVPEILAGQKVCG